MGGTAGVAYSGGALVSIQILRAIAALGVLAHHTMFDMSTRYGGPVVLDNLVIGAAGVDLFFVISGFVMVYASDRLFGRPEAPRIFMLRRLARIVPLYWTVTAIILSWIALRHGGHVLAVYPPEQILASLLFYPLPRVDGQIAPVHGLGWTLNYEMFFYVVFAAAIALPRERAIVAVIALFVTIAAAGAALPLPQPFAFWCNPIILEFCFGMLIGLAYLRGVRISRATSMAIGVVAVGAFALSALKGMELAWRPLEWGLPSAALVAAMTLSRETARPGAPGRFFVLLGDASYSLYLLHGLVSAGMRQTIARWIDFTAAPWAFAATFFAVSIVVAIAAYIFVEGPVTRWLKVRLQERKQPAIAT